MASLRSTERKDLRGQVLLRHQKRPFLSVAFATNMEGGQIMVATRSLESSRVGRYTTRPLKSRSGHHFRLGETITRSTATSFFHTPRSGTPPPTKRGQKRSAIKTRTACMKNTKNTHPPFTAEKSAMRETRAESSRNRNALFATVSLRCALCARQYCRQVSDGGFSCKSNDTKHSVALVIAPKTARNNKVSNPDRPGHTSSGDEHFMPTYACSVATGSNKNTVSTSCMPRRSISAFLCLKSFTRKARHAANAVPSWHIDATAPAVLTIFLKSSFVKPNTRVAFFPESSSISRGVGIG